MDNLPEDIFLEILLLQPVKSLLRFKVVCKSWRSHISNPDFVKRHVLRTTKTPNNDLFIAHNESCSYRLHVFDINFLDRPKSFNIPKYVSNDIGIFDSFVGSCNGLFCIAYRCRSQRLPLKLHLWNPATKTMKDIHRYIINHIPSTIGGGYVYFGFGFDNATSDYKVVRIVQISNVRLKSFENRAEVYSLNENSWKEVEVKLKFGDIISHHSIVNESIYWIVIQRPYTVDFGSAILCFNVQSQNFSTISLPDNYLDMWYRNRKKQSMWSNVHVFEFKESVAIIKHGQEGIGIYTLDDDSCWIKKLTINSLRHLVGIGWLKTGDFVGDFSKETVLYDPVNEVVNPILPGSHISRIYSFSESLLNLS